MLGGGEDKRVGVCAVERRYGWSGADKERERERGGDHSGAAIFQFLLGRVRLSPASENELPFSEAGDGLTGP